MHRSLVVLAGTEQYTLSESLVPESVSLKTNSQCSISEQKLPTFHGPLDFRIWLPWLLGYEH